MVKIFGQDWVYLAHESEIPNPNDFKTGYLGKRPITITRNRNGEIHSFLNRCMHRGARFATKRKDQPNSLHVLIMDGPTAIMTIWEECFTKRLWNQL